MAEHLDENGFVVLDSNDGPSPRALAIVECGLCDDDGYRGARVCDHREHSTPEARQAAKDRLRAALAKCDNPVKPFQANVTGGAS